MICILILTYISIEMPGTGFYYVDLEAGFIFGKAT